MIRTKRVSDPPPPKKRTRILADYLWQRRLSNEKATVTPVYLAEDREHTIATVLHQSLEEKVA
jgi:uncharacterized protein YeaO (DUF488 family)